MRLIRPGAWAEARRIRRGRYAAPLTPPRGASQHRTSGEARLPPRHHRGMAQTTDALRRYLDLLVDTIDEEVGGDDLARRAYLSRFHFDRVVRAAVGEPPAALRRRSAIGAMRAAGVDGVDYGDPID